MHLKYALLVLGALFVAPLSVDAAIRQAHSTNWAGYVASEGNYDGVGARWVIPTVKVDDADAGHATWVGIGGYGRKDLIQAGTLAIAKKDGTISYAAWYEMLPDSAKRIPLKVKPGDKIEVSLVEKVDDKWIVTVENETSGKTFQKTLKYESSYKSAEWIQEMPSRLDGSRLPLDRFGEVTITDAWALQRGKRVSIDDERGYRLDMVDQKGKEIATTARLKSDGKSFTVRRTKQLVTESSVNSSVKGASYQKLPARRIKIIWPK